MIRYTEFRSMNTGILLIAEGEPGRIETGFHQARSLIEGYAQQFTRFSEQSELMQLNRSAGSWFHVSPDLYQVVWQARQFFDQTQGLFNPAILDALIANGYDRSLEEIRFLDQVPLPVTPRMVPGISPVEYFGSIRFDPQTCSICLPSGVHIDLGGIAKGWIAEKAAHLLSQYADAGAVNAGGDLFVFGLPASETAWPIELEDPINPQNTLALLTVKSGAVATSTTTRRTWNQAGIPRHHLIDPYTGRPARSDWLSVTVLAPHAAQAEVFAKALLIAGPQRSEEIAQRAPEITYIAVDQEGQLWGTKQSMEILAHETKQPIK